MATKEALLQLPQKTSAITKSVIIYCKNGKMTIKDISPPPDSTGTNSEASDPLESDFESESEAESEEEAEEEEEQEQEAEVYL